MKEHTLSYSKNMSYVNSILISPSIKIVILYTHFMKNSKNTWNFETHTHSFNELHFVLGGYCKMLSEDKELFLSENECVLLPANSEHRFIECSDDFFRLSAAFDIVCEQETALIPQVGFFGADEKCDFYIKTALNEYEDNKIGCKNIADSMLCCLLIEILRKTDIFDSADSFTRISTVFFEAKQFIDNNISQKITPTDVAEKVFLSARHLNRVFKQIWG